MNLWTDFSSSDSDSNPSADSDHRAIREAIPFFERNLQARQESVRRIAEQSLLVIELIFEALDKRRAAWATRVAEGIVDIEPEPES